MTAIEFVYWLNGALELGGMKTMDTKQVQIVKDHIALVLTKITPEVPYDLEWLKSYMPKEPITQPDKPKEWVKVDMNCSSASNIDPPTTQAQVEVGAKEPVKPAKTVEELLRELTDPTKTYIQTCDAPKVNNAPDCLSGFFTPEQQEASEKLLNDFMESMKKNNHHWNSGGVVCGSGRRYC